MIDLFSDILACRGNALTRLDARVKLLGALAAIVAVLFSRNPVLPLALVAAAVLAALALRLPAGFLVRRMVSPLGIVLVLLALKSLLGGATPLVTIPVGPWHISPSREGAVEGLLIGVRVLGAAGVVVLLGAVTPAHRIFHALRWLGLPAAWVEVAGLMYRYTFVLLDEVEDVARAQRVRLGYATPRRAAASVGSLAGLVLLRALEQSDRTYEAMRLRLYRGHMPYAPLAPLARADWAKLILWLGSLGALFASLEGIPR